MGDDPKRDWTKWIIATVITAGTIVIGLIQFGLNYGLSVRQPLLEAQTKECLAASENAARLASTLDLAIWKRAREEFWMLYWGPLAIVEDVGLPQGQGRVAVRMVEFGRELKMVDANAPPLPLAQLEQNALAISYACRDLLVSRWTAGLFH